MNRIIVNNKRIIDFELLNDNKNKKIGYTVFYYEYLFSSKLNELNENEINEINEIIKNKINENKEYYKLLLVGIIRYFV